MTRPIQTKEKLPTIIDGVRYDIYVTYPTDETEVYTYKFNSETMHIATVTYVDDTKEELVSVIWSK